MPVSEYGPRLNFLRNSASSFDSLSPSTAAHLLSVHNRILHDDLKPLNQRHREFSCGACGAIRKLETSKTIEIKKKKSKRAGSSSDGTTIYKCLRCRRRTVKPHRKEPIRSKPPSRSISTTQETINNTPELPTDTTTSQQLRSNPVEAPKTTENANSKKRAKARKQGGLQAMLASKQQSQSASSPLDLFDFLQ